MSLPVPPGAPPGIRPGASPYAPGPDPRDPMLFRPLLDAGEEVLWTGRPAFLPFLLGGVPFLVFGLLWGAFDYFGFIRHMIRGAGSVPGGFAGFAIPFFALHLFPFWGSILNMVRLAAVHRNTVYAFTNRRMIVRTGAFGIDFRSLDHDRVADLEVNVGPVENVLGVGTVRARLDGKRAESFAAIPRPYEVYRELKRVAMDVKTDMEYPNAMRPPENPGYGTRYAPGRGKGPGAPPPAG